MSLRRIEPLSLMSRRGLTPSMVATARPIFLEVDPCDLWVDETYQRELAHRSIKLIRATIAGWDWRSYKPPVVVEVDGRLHVIDGQHTAIAAATYNEMVAELEAATIGKLTVMRVDAATVEERARAFIGQNLTRVGITQYQLFRAAVAAGDEDAMTAVQVCDRARVKIISNSYVHPSERHTMAVNAIKELAKRQGAMVARQILEAVADAGVTPVAGTHLRAAELLMRDPSYAKDRISYAELTATIRKTTRAFDIETDQLAKAMAIPRYRALALYWSRCRVKAARAA